MLLIPGKAVEGRPHIWCIRSRFGFTPSRGGLCLPALSSTASPEATRWAKCLTPAKDVRKRRSIIKTVDCYSGWQIKIPATVATPKDDRENSILSICEQISSQSLICQLMTVFLHPLCFSRFSSPPMSASQVIERSFLRCLLTWFRRPVKAGTQPPRKPGINIDQAAQLSKRYGLEPRVKSKSMCGLPKNHSGWLEFHSKTPAMLVIIQFPAAASFLGTESSNVSNYHHTPLIIPEVNWWK